ncbi:MAG: MBL fold metallo-hydrolase [Clostridiales bacterium]|nr:MBL fold metallo-hydrolase [Clostridiales bacterium]
MSQCRAPDTIPMNADAFAPRDDTALYWLAGAGFLLNSRGKTILVDPVLTTRVEQPNVCETGLPLLVDYPIDAKSIPMVDAVLYTHIDNDHLGPVTAGILMALDPLFVGTPLVCQTLMDRGVKRYHSGNAGDITTIGTCIVEITPADHPWQLLDPWNYGRAFEPGDCCGFKITTPDGTFLFTGDTRLMKAHLDIAGIDVLALDVSRCRYHLGVDGAAVLANSLEDAILIPYHYGTFDCPDNVAHNGDPRDVLARVKNAAARTRNLAPGQPFVIANGREMQ